MRGAARWMAVVLWAAGFMLLGYCGMSCLDSRLQQIEGGLKLDRLLRHEVHAPTAPPVYTPSHGDLIGRIAVPRLGLTAIVFEGTDDEVLHRGVGHLTGSALPDQPGNVVLAGHRDSFFRDLRNIRKGDVIDVTTAEFGARRYEVESTEIVEPTQTSVEAPTRTPTLTLITCYPFNYVGNAPQRFIIRAEDALELAARNKAPAATASKVDDADAPPQPPHYVSYAIFSDTTLDSAVR
jgi:sortase A